MLIDLATKLVNDFEPLVSNLGKEQSESFMRELDRLRKDFADDLFLENVFGPKSYLPRIEWENNVLTGVSWLFDATKFRKEVYSYIRKQIGDTASP